MDIYSRRKRSEVMASVRSEDTAAEMTVRRTLHSLGYRYRLHSKDLAGKPDIVLPKHSAIIFVHGCFWHHHRSCGKSKLPKANSEFWQRKILDNARRDKRNIRQLREAGWKVLVVWECEIKQRDMGNRLVDFLGGS